MSGVTIRIATLPDLDVVTAMVDGFLGETTYGGQASDRAVLDGHIRGFLSGEVGRAWLAEVDGTPVGLIAAFVFPHFLSGARVGNELIWWVEPWARGTAVAERLLDHALAWAKNEGAVSFQMTAWRPALGRWYQRLGFVAMETVFFKAI